MKKVINFSAVAFMLTGLSVYAQEPQQLPTTPENQIEVPATPPSTTNEVSFLEEQTVIDTKTQKQIDKERKLIEKRERAELKKQKAELNRNKKQINTQKKIQSLTIKLQKTKLDYQKAETKYSLRKAEGKMTTMDELKAKASLLKIQSKIHQLEFDIKKYTMEYNALTA